MGYKIIYQVVWEDYDGGYAEGDYEESASFETLEDAKEFIADMEEDEEFLEDYDQYNSEYLDRKCVDAKGKEVCYVYQFSIESDGAEGGTTDILASIK